MIAETFFSYKNFRWLWINIIFLVILILVYFWDNPLGGRGGGTILGYTYGIIATMAVLYLMWFGIRKRSHYAVHTTLFGCLSAHVWIGIALIIIVPLHCAFSFGFNVHTLAYVLLLLTILSGIVGGVIYVRNPIKVKSHRGEGTIKSLLEQINSISQEIDFLSKNRSDNFLRLYDYLDFVYRPTVSKAILKKSLAEVDREKVAEILASISAKESDDAYRLLTLTTKKRNLAEQVDLEVRLQASFRSWLYLHLPLSFALLATIAVHIFSVLLYH